MLKSIVEDRERVKGRECYDPSIYVYAYRDHYLTEAAGLADYAWALCRFDSYTHRNDVLGFLELLEKKLNEMKGERE